MLYGRSAETARIDGMLGAARAGHSGAIVLRGEPGVGKTALLDYAAAAGEGMRVLRGTGIESEMELAFAALQLLLRPGLGSMDVLPAPQAVALRGAFGLASSPSGDRFLIGLAALSVMSELAGDGALVCLVDDAHWLDRASADALLFAARRLDAEGIALLFAARDEGFSAPGLTELRLGGLDRDASRAVLGEHSPGLPPAVADRVLEEAAGNPLALRELPSAARGTPDLAPLPLPNRIQEAYFSRVTGLPAPARTFLLVAAAEETGDLGVILRAAEVLGVTADAVDAAERSGLVAIHRLAVRFQHPLVRAAVYQGATFAERGAAHGALARVLVGEPDADRRAWHRAAAATGSDESIAAELEHTAARAQQRLGYATAAIALERAARLTPQPPDRARRLVAAATAAMHAGRADAAVTLADQALRLTTEPAALARIATVRAWVAMEGGSLRSAHELLVTGAAPIVGLDPVSATAMLKDAVRAAWWVGDAKLVQDAASVLRPALASVGSERAAFVCDGLQAMADLLAGHPDRAVPRLQDVVAAARRVPPAQLDVRDTAATFAMLVGDFDASRALLLSTAEGCRSQGMIRSLPLVHLHLAYAEFRLNRFRAAAVSAAEGLRLAYDTGQPVHIAGLHAVLALLAAAGGDEPLCRDLARQALDRFAGEIVNVSAMAEWALGLLDLSLGQFDAALERFEATASGPLRHHIHPVYFATDQVEAAARLGAPDRAEEPLARFAAWAGASGQPWALAVLHRCRALLDNGAGAEDNYRAALRLHAQSGRPFEHARSAMLYGEWLRRARRATDARTQLRAALALFDRTGAAPWADRARAELRAAGESTMSGTPAPDKLSLLTPQELQVVRLAASGATNRDIAAQLFLSPRTVSHHLYRAFPKLGVTTRTALAHLDLALPEEDLT